jgi:putative FmdB family regulatory protein
MPVYEYKCNGCGNQFEMRQKFSDAPVTECPQCGGEVAKLISATAFTLKGGGWYAEGYGNGKSKPADTAPSCPSGGNCSGCPSAAA